MSDYRADAALVPGLTLRDYLRGGGAGPARMRGRRAVMGDLDAIRGVAIGLAVAAVALTVLTRLMFGEVEWRLIGTAVGTAAAVAAAVILLAHLL